MVFSEQDTKMNRFLHAHIFFQGLNEMKVKSGWVCLRAISQSSVYMYR
jgi:hypothetical protein